jgi:hypothetical protein
VSAEFDDEPYATRHRDWPGSDGQGAGPAPRTLSDVVGDWLGVVNYEISYADGRPEKLQLADQLVPFHVLRKRD